MKVTTDGTLLGAWANCSSAENILDIGAGTGLITLMLAQRCDAHIVAVEPGDKSFEELVENISASPWSSRISLYQMTFQDFTGDKRQKVPAKFDMIVSNPPFFVNDKLPDDPAKAAARHTVTLSYDNLLAGVVKTLSREGKFSIILPAEVRSYFISMAVDNKLFCNRVLQIRSRPGKNISRILLEFSRTKMPLRTRELVIHNGISYTKDYKNLTRDYYISF